MSSHTLTGTYTCIKQQAWMILQIRTSDFHKSTSLKPALYRYDRYQQISRSTFVLPHAHLRGLEHIIKRQIADDFLSCETDRLDSGKPRWSRNRICELKWCLWYSFGMSTLAYGIHQIFAISLG